MKRTKIQTKTFFIFCCFWFKNCLSTFFKNFLSTAKCVSDFEIFSILPFVFLIIEIKRFTRTAFPLTWERSKKIRLVFFVFVCHGSKQIRDIFLGATSPHFKSKALLRHISYQRRYFENFYWPTQRISLTSLRLEYFERIYRSFFPQFH